MMKFVLTLGMIWLGVYFSFGQQWFPESTIHRRSVNAVSILKVGEIVTGGGNESNDSIENLERTDNSGLYWDFFRDTISSWIKSVAFADTLKGCAVGYNGKLMRTADGGFSWVYGSSPIIRDFNKVIYVTPTMMFVAGGWPAGDSAQTILKSNDGGINWSVVYDQPGPWLKAIFFVDTLKGFATGDSGTLLKTMDGGQTWNNAGSPLIRNFNAVFFTDTNTGFIAGGDTAGGGEIRTILRTSNGGLNWNVIKDEPGGQLNDVSFAGAQYGIIVGDSISVYRTSDGGQTWFAQIPQSTSAANEVFNSVKIYDTSYAVIGSSMGYIYIHSDVQAPEAITLGPVNVDSVGAILTGNISTNGALGIYWFTFSTDSLFGHYGNTPQQSILTDSLTIVQATLNSLTTNKWYYYYVTVANIAGTVNGQVQRFYTDTPLIFIQTDQQTLVAHDISPQTATLYGAVNVNGERANIFFQYGIGQAFDHEAAANPGFISGDTLTTISAALTGLQHDQEYYFRVKVVDTFGSYYSESRSFFAVNNEIPSWNFENWQSVENRFPHEWWTWGNVAMAPSYNGTTALSLFGTPEKPFGGSFTGITGNGYTFGGTPFTARPDSFIFYANYSVAAGDTAFGLLQLRKNGAIISFTLAPLTGTTSDAFVRIAVPISYSSFVNPDTALVGFISTNFLFSHAVAQSWLKVDDISLSGTTQSLPASDFEQWDSSAYMTPVGWATAYTELPVNFNTPYKVQRTTDAYVGNYAVELHNSPVLVNNQFFSPAAVQTYKNPPDGPHPSFAVTKRYKTFNGYVKYAPQNDTASITVNLYRAGNLIGSGSWFADSAMNVYTPFFMPITYADTTTIPDSASIRIQDDYATLFGTGTLTIDNLGFDGYYYYDSTYTGVPIVTEEGNLVSLNIYPNPNNGTLHVDYTSPLDEEITLAVYDLNGRPVYTENREPVTGNKTSFELSLSTLPPSVYFIRVKSKSSGITSRFIIAR
jgi:photosystem II stability/assembly factor-like uncharacterized protein